MSFVGRPRELEALEEHFETDAFEFLVVLGPRRVGKSALLRRFIEGKKAVYFTSLETDTSTNLRNLSRAIQFGLKEPEGGVFVDYDAAFGYLFRRSCDERIVVVFDEFPFAAKTDPSLASVLQRLIDLHHNRSKMMLFLCGSPVVTMEKTALNYSSPLYGRRTGQLRLRPLNYFDAREFLPHRTPEEAALLFGTVGGMPGYLKQFEGTGSFDEILKKTWFSESSSFSEEPANLLRREVRAPEIYFPALQAIAKGASRLHEISVRIGKDSAATVSILRTLIELGLVVRETPYGTMVSRRSRYRIADNMFRFWCTFYAPNTPILARGGTGDVVLERVRPHLCAYMKPVFDGICRDWLWRQQVRSRTSLFFRSLGRWWGLDPKTKREVEIDLMGEEDEHKALFAACRWENDPMDTDVLEVLEDRSRRLFHYTERQLYLFSVSGFTDACRRRAAELSNVRLVTFAEMVDEISITD
mgnify:FL=1